MARITSKGEVEKAAEEYSKKVNGPHFDELYPNCDATIGEITAKDFKAGVEFSEQYVQYHIQDIIIENQGLKLYKDNEAKRFKKLAVNFAYYCLMHDWLQNGFRCGGLSTEEIYDKFINDPDEANS